MLYQQDEIAVGSLCQCLFDITFLGEVLAVAIVLHTCKHDMVLVAAEDQTLIVSSVQPNCFSILIVSLQFAALMASLQPRYSA